MLGATRQLEMVRPGRTKNVNITIHALEVGEIVGLEQASKCARPSTPLAIQR